MKRERNSFLTPLDVRVMESGKRFMLLNQFTYLWGTTKITVPAWFVTDFASIPWLLRLIIPKLGRWNKAAVVHDYLYQKQPAWFTRKVADVVFRDAMRDSGVKPWKYNLMYLAVRMWGGISWRSYRRRVE